MKRRNKILISAAAMGLLSSTSVLAVADYQDPRTGDIVCAGSVNECKGNDGCSVGSGSGSNNGQSSLTPCNSEDGMHDASVCKRAGISKEPLSVTGRSSCLSSGGRVVGGGN